MKILVIRFSSLGDIVLTETVLRSLQNQWPEAEIDYLAKPVYHPLLEIMLPQGKLHAWESPKRPILKKLKETGYDLVIDLSDKLVSRLLRLIFRKSRYVVYDKKHLTRWLITKKMTGASINSTVDLYHSVLEKLDVQPVASEPRLEPGLRRREKIHKLFEEYHLPPGITTIGIFPGATHGTKRYPLEYLAWFIDEVPPSWGCRFVICGTTAEKQEALRLKRLCSTTMTDLCGAVDSGQLVALIAELDGIVTNDSGPMHIAAALQKPQIAIFGATSTRLGFRPLNDHAYILEQDIRCRPCSLHGSSSCPKGHYHCMLTLRPETLRDTFKDMLENEIWELL